MNDGLLGALRRAGSGVAASISKHDAWSIRLVFFAGIVTILQKAGVSVPYYPIVFAVSLGVAALLYEMNATTYSLRAFWSGRPFGAIGWALVWCVAFLYSMNQWVGAASENEAKKSNLHKAAFTQTVDNRDALAKASREVDRLQEKLRMAPVRTAEAAQASIDNAMSHKFWRLTDGCKETRGPQTRKFCSDYASAVADKAGATEAMTLREELKSAQDKYELAKADVGKTQEFTEARNDLVILTDFAGLSERNARVVNALGSIIAISIFLSLATALREMEALRKDGPRKPMFGSIFRWLRQIMTGKEPAAEPRHSPAGGIFQASNDYAPPARSAGLSPAELQERIRYALKVKHGTIGDLISAQQATA